MTEELTPRPSLTSIAYARLKDAIVTCALPPGTRITERALARDLDLGLTPVREGLGRLANEGLVITLPRRGYLVTPLTEHGVDELFQVWRHVCGAVAELAVINGTDEQLEHVIAVIETSLEREIGSAVDNRQGETLFEAFGQAAGNERLMALFRALSTEIGRLFVLAYSEVEGQEILRNRPNRAFVTLIRRRDAEQLRKRVMAFNDANHELVRKVLRTHPSLTAPSEPPVLASE
ncbi:GntR family transcriptional regulator [uncultured Jatrophihabitans sp.]|uniref:GntR family transcriptional regulator n=1 Tax=uncultured Jatrophihabitans sp. TaxID=1610747 RepID=UPI0035CBF144